MSRYRRHIPLVLGVLVVVLAADIAFTFTRTPRYTGEATIYYSPQHTDLGEDKAAPGAAEQARDQAVDTQVEVIKSPLVADAVISALHLDQDPNFVPKPGSQPADPATARDAMIDRVVQPLKVRRVGQTLLIHIDYTDKSPTKAARIANAFADAFIAHDLQTKLGSSRNANVLLNSQIDDMRQKVEQAENSVAQYKSANNLLGTDTNNTLTQQNISLIDQQLALARSDEAQARARLEAAQKQLKSGSNGEDVGEALDSNTISQLRRARADLSAKVADLQGRYGPMHPDLRNAEAQLKDTDLQIQQEINRIMSNLSAQVEVAHGRTASIEGSLGKQQGDLSAGAQASVKLNELQRNADAARGLYENVLQRVKETSAQQAVSQADSRVDTPATPPSAPSSPNKPLNILLGLVLGIGLGSMAVLVREKWNAQLTNLEDVEGVLGLPFLGSIPTMQSSIEKLATREPIDAVCVHPLSGFAEAFRGLATTLIHSQPGGGQAKLIAVTSALPGEGKTVTSISLARAQAMGGKKVILLDCDLRRRSANVLLSEEPALGLTEIIEGKATLDQVIKIDDKTGCHFVPLTKNAHLSKSPFSSPVFDALLADLRERYDLVVLDTPPLLPVVDTRILAQKVDALALLVRWRSTPVGAVKSAVHMLDSVNAPVTGVALTQVNQKAQAYSGYGYPAYYHRDFKRYYQS